MNYVITITAFIIFFTFGAMLQREGFTAWTMLGLLVILVMGIELGYFLTAWTHR